MAARLKLARERAGFETAADAVRRFGWRESTYFGHENGSRGIRADVATRYARAFRVSSSWLLYGEGEPNTADVAPIGRKVPVVGRVQAGAWTELPDEDTIETYIPINLPEFDRADLFALRVVGHSMDMHYKDGSTVVVCPTAQAGVRAGDHVIVRRRRSNLFETTIKEVRLGVGGEIELWPCSTDPAFQKPLLIRQEPDSDDGAEIMGLVVAAYEVRAPSRGPIIQF